MLRNIYVQLYIFVILNRLPANDHSSHTLHMLSKTIDINLFDEVVVDILEDQRKRATTVHHRIEKRWLGKLALPLSTLVLRQMVIFIFMLLLFKFSL